MPRSRGSEMPQRKSPRGPHPLRTSSSESDHRPTTERSPKLGDRRSPRGPSPDSLNQKKLGTRIADLESQLGQAQEELKILKDQLASAEAAKKEAQQELENKTKTTIILEPDEIQEKHQPMELRDFKKADDDVADAVSDDNQKETEVFEVPVKKEAAEAKVEPGHLIDQVEEGNFATKISSETLATLEPAEPSLHDSALKDDEINMLEAKLEKKENELEEFGKENENLKNLLNEATSNISSAKTKEEQLSMRLSQLGEELEQSKANEAHLKEKLESAEGAKETLEAEIKKMRVQTEQWRKAADAAAAVLAGAVEMNGRITERCGSMDKQFGGMFGTTGGGGGYTGFVGSPGIADDLDDGFGSGKRKSSGIKMFGDLWKKKSQK